MALGTHRSGSNGESSAADAAVKAAIRYFGGTVEATSTGAIVVNGIEYVHDPSSDPSFIVRPECDRCGSTDVDQFPLETWEIDGVPVLGQAKTTCRECRFLLIPTTAVRGGTLL